MMILQVLKWDRAMHKAHGYDCSSFVSRNWCLLLEILSKYTANVII